MSMIALLSLTAASALLTTLFLAMAIRKLRGQRRPARGNVRPGASSTLMQKQPRRLAQLISLGAFIRPTEEDDLEVLRSRTTRAGLYGQDAVELYLTARMIALFIGAGLALASITWAGSPLNAALMALSIGAGAVLLPGVWLDRRAASRQAAVAYHLPEVLDLLVLCLEAGLSLEKALQRVVRSGQDADGRADDLLRQELGLVLADMKVSIPVDVAFKRLATRIGGDETRSFSAVIGRATSLGAQISDMLKNHAIKLRQSRILQLEETSGKASAQLALPLTLCLLPAGMLLLMGPTFFLVLTSL